MGIIMFCLHISIAKWSSDDEMIVHLLGLWIIIYGNHLKTLSSARLKLLWIEDYKRHANDIIYGMYSSYDSLVRNM